MYAIRSYYVSLSHYVFGLYGKWWSYRWCDTRSNRLLLPNKAYSQQKYGGAMRDRTADLLRAKQALSQLSYSPESVSIVSHLLLRQGVAQQRLVR